jgi:single-stranded-DNA-specific exonuclease
VVSEHIPNRFDEGYGLNIDALEMIHANGVRLVISVDCGIRSIREANAARSMGLDLIITDHHTCTDELPAALAVVNPRQPGDEYPEKELAGVGLAYKLVQALLQTNPVPGLQVEDWLDLVALGTVADLAALVGENRYLVRKGLQQIRLGKRQGLLSLAMSAGLAIEKTNTMDIGFMLGPRLNAAGRLESALTAYQLLTATDLATTGLLAQHLEIQNRQRQDKTRLVQARVEQMMLAQTDDTHLIFAADPEFNPGVVGLAASRLTELYYRPAIVAFQNDDYTRGSCRSIPGFHITEALDQCADLLERHGGHAAAAGFTVLNDRLPLLKERLTAIAVEKLGDLTKLQRVLEADLEIELCDLDFGMLDMLGMIQPTGYGNPEPVFVTRNLKVQAAKTVGKESQHLRLTVGDGKRKTCNAIAFRQGYHVNRLPPMIDLMYTLERNEYRGWVELQLNVRDIREGGSS